MTWVECFLQQTPALEEFYGSKGIQESRKKLIIYQCEQEFYKLGVTHVASPTKSSFVKVSLSIILIFSSVTLSEMVKRKVSFHSGQDPSPAYELQHLRSNGNVLNII